MVSRGEHENKDVGCKRTTVLRAFTVMRVWTEIAETFSVPRSLQSKQLLISNKPVTCMFTTPIQAVLFAGIYLTGWALHCYI